MSAFDGIWTGAVLDCGARSGNLRDVLRGRPVTYTSLDLFPPADIVASLDERLPIADRAHDVVVALDVLEHTNDFHFALSELCRVAARHVVVSLPNCLDVGSRLRLARGRHISAKYGLPIEPRLDRHRWFFSLEDARAFLGAYPTRHGFGLAQERVLAGPRRALLGPLVRRWPNFWGPTYVALLERVTPTS